MESSAIQFCARKVSAVAGDMRKALDVCRRAVEAAESEARCQTVLRVSGEKHFQPSCDEQVLQMGGGGDFDILFQCSDQIWSVLITLHRFGQY